MNTPQNLLAHLRNAETNHIGFSYNINNGNSNPETGYMVSQKGYEQTAPQGCDLVAYGRNYFLLHAEQLADPTAYMGCWYTEGRFVFDISHNIETMDNAIEMGMTNEQDAIWDCASGSEYRLMREGDSPSRLVTIYYNDVFVSEEPNEIYANCPYVIAPIEKAIEYADRMIDNKHWDAYCIPELCNHEVKFTEVLFQRDGDEYSEHMVGMVEAMYEAIDEFEGMYNHCAGEDKDHYETRIAQLNNVLNLLNSLK
jgi:hypothetical protein